MATPRMSPEELQNLLEDGSQPVMVIDVRAKERFDQGHVPGALHIPVADIKANPPDLPKEHKIVTYCGGGTSGVTAAKILSELGYDAHVMEGFRAWEAANLPVER